MHFTKCVDRDPLWLRRQYFGGGYERLLNFHSHVLVLDLVVRLLDRLLGVCAGGHRRLFALHVGKLDLTRALRFGLQLAAVLLRLIEPDTVALLHAFGHGS